MNKAKSEEERTGIRLTFTMTARAEREVNGGAHLFCRLLALAMKRLSVDEMFTIDPPPAAISEVMTAFTPR